MTTTRTKVLRLSTSLLDAPTNDDVDDNDDDDKDDDKENNDDYGMMSKV